METMTSFIKIPPFESSSRSRSEVIESSAEAADSSIATSVLHRTKGSMSNVTPTPDHVNWVL
jgi:hypothetical protein